jgi:hypothetical protein
MIAGYPLKSQIEATIRALEHEKAGAQGPRHLESIEAQIGIFQAELRKMEKEGYGDEHRRTAHPAAGTSRYWPPRQPGIGGVG